jgi:D-aminoacyl-tRNA deacylase
VIALIQRVSQASVAVNGDALGDTDTPAPLLRSIGRGLLVLLCAERGDTAAQGTQLLNKLLRYRVFADAAGKMNLSVTDIAGQLLIVSQFTLAADTRSGTRPSFGPAADPATARLLYDHCVAQARSSGLTVATGAFGADMQVSLTNDGPVTFWLQVKPQKAQD